MTLRAGSYNAEKPRWQGVIRNDSWPAYVCYHWGENEHPDPRSARDCAKRALAYIKANNQLPEGWAPSESDKNAR